MKNKHLLVILVGGSGTGKTTVAEKLIGEGYFNKAITCTTRQPREGEIRGKDYYFLDNKEELDKMYNNNELIESPTQFGSNWYACPIKSVYSTKKPTLVIIEYEGLKKALGLLKKDSNLIVAPVFMESLPENVVKQRMIERKSTNEEISERIKEMEKEKYWGDDDSYVLRIKQDLKLDKDASVNKSAEKIRELIDIYKPVYGVNKKNIFTR